MFTQQLINGFTLGSLYAIVAVGYTLIFGVLNIINMAHGEVFMLGAFVGLMAVTVLGVGIVPALMLAMLTGAILGALLEYVALRPLRGKKVSHLAPLISTIGVSIFLESLALHIWGPQTRTFPSDLRGVQWGMGDVQISAVQVIGLGTAILLMLALNFLISYTKMGKSIRATAENPEAAKLLGIHTNAVVTYTVMLSSALGSAAGVLIGLSFDAIEPMMGISMSFKGLAVLILGGLGNIRGAMIGGFILGIAEVFSVVYGASSYRDAVAFAMIILLLFWRPQGLFGGMLKGGRP